MNKILIATKYKDGWLIEVKITYTVPTKDDVFKHVRYEGLIINTELMKYNENKVIAS